MGNSSEHIAEAELALAATGELSARRAGPVRAHIRQCATCRGRLHELEDIFAAFAAARRQHLDARLPQSATSRWRFQQILAQCGHQSLPRGGPALSRSGLAAALAALAIAAGLAWLTSFGSPVAAPASADAEVRIRPDPGITPGAAVAVPVESVCRDIVKGKGVERAIALEVFRTYGIRNPEPNAYELDYSIPPELGGASDARNLWPQPYGGNAWNANAKDALEARLRHLVCTGEVRLEAAQQALARDWIGAYQQYFRTDRPLVEHAGFLKDTPWR